MQPACIIASISFFISFFLLSSNKLYYYSFSSPSDLFPKNLPSNSFSMSCSIVLKLFDKNEPLHISIDDEEDIDDNDDDILSSSL